MTVKDLLLKLLEYNFLWKSHYSSKPSNIRRNQIESLIEAFQLSKNHINPFVKSTYYFSNNQKGISRTQFLGTLSNIEYLERGEFLSDRSYSQYQKLTNDAIDIIKKLYNGIPENSINKPVDVKWMFNSLYNFRQKIYNLTYPNEGMLEGFSVGLLYSKFLQAELKKIINENLDEIDYTLCLILDPKGLKFSVKELEQKYSYQNIDLKNIDLEWRMENY